MTGSRRVSRYTTASELCLLAAVAFCALALGGAPHWVVPPLVALSLASFGLALHGAHRQRQRFPFPALAAIPLLGAALCLVQLVPLPPPLLRLLSPPAAELREFALLPLGLDRWRPISLDPPSTWVELAKHAAYLALFLSAAQLARSRAARQRLLLSLVGLGTLVVLIGLGHSLAGAESLFGFFRYSTTPPLLTTFGNPNHLGGYLGLCATLALGLLLSDKGRGARLVFGAAYALLGLGVFLSLSRGAMAFFAGGQLLFGALLLLSRRAESQRAESRSKRKVAALGAALGLVSVLSISAYVAYDRIADELATADSLEKLQESKVDLWPMMAGAARPFSVGGMGRGAYALAFPRFQTERPEVTFTHPENVLLQLWSELGVLALAAFLALSARGVARLLKREELSIADLAVLAGAGALLLQNLFDFSVELPAAASALALSLGVLSRPQGEEREELPVRRVVPPALVLGALALVALAPGWRTAAKAEEALLAEWQNGASLAELEALGVKLIDRHPADYVLYDMLGQAHASADPLKALAFANRALFLRPLDVEAHRVAARSLLRLGRRGQAFLELKLAYQASRHSGVVLTEAMGLARTAEEIQRAVPAEPERIHAAYGVLSKLGRKEDAAALVEWALAELGTQGDAAILYSLSAQLRLARKEHEAALELIGEAERREPGNPQHLVWRARVLAAMGRRPEGIALLEAAAVRSPDGVAVSLELARQLLAAREPRRAREALKRASPFARTVWDRVQLLSTEGRSYEVEGRHAMALRSYQTAARLKPTAPAHYQVARAFEQLGKYSDAKAAVHEGMRLDTQAGSDAQKAWLTRLDESAAKQLIELERELLAPRE